MYFLLYDKPIGQHRSLLDNYHTFFHRIQRVIRILQVMSAIDAHIIPYPAVLVDDGVADIAAVTDAHCRKTMCTGQLDLFDGLVKVDAHQVAADYGCTC